MFINLILLLYFALIQLFQLSPYPSFIGLVCAIIHKKVEVELQNITYALENLVASSSCSFKQKKCLLFAEVAASIKFCPFNATAFQNKI